MTVAAPAVPESSLSKPLVSASPWIILIVLASGEFMILLDTTIVNVAIPSMISSLHATGDQVLWVLNAYILTFAILLIMSGRLGGMLGPKRLFIAGLIIFTLASAACGLAQTSNQLILFRVVQAVGGAALVPQTLSILTSVFPVEKQGAAFGIWGAVYGLGAVSGPTLGGFLTTTFSWRAIFLPNVPVGLMAAILAFLLMPDLKQRSRHRLDHVGMGLATAGLSALIFALVEGQKYGWGRISRTASFDLGPIHASLISIPTILLASAVFLSLFVLWETREPEPLLPMSLLRDRNFAVGCVVSAIQVFGMAGLFLPLSILLQAALGLTALQAGIALVPCALASMVTAPLAGKLAVRLNAKYLVAAGLGLYVAGMGVLVSIASTRATGLTFTFPLVLIGLGIGLTFAPLVSTTMRNILPAASGAASGFMNTIRQVGSSLGASIVGALLLTRLASEQRSLAVYYAVHSHLSPQQRGAFIAGFSHRSGDLLKLGSSHSQGNPLGQLVFQHAFVNAVKPALMVPLGLAAFAAALALLMKPALPEQTGQEHPAAASPKERVADVASVHRTGSVQVPICAPVGITTAPLMTASLQQQLIATVPLHSLRCPFLKRIDADDHVKHFLKGALTIGRAHDNDVVVEDAEVSRRHAALRLGDYMPLVRDLHSANGTRVNGTLLTPGDHPLHDGDILTTGDTSFVFHNDLERARPLLEQTAGGQGRYQIDRTLTIGRLPTNEVVVNDTKVSRHHAEMTSRGGVVTIRDLNSLNGTRVNGELVGDNYLLQDGDLITVGDASFVYHNDYPVQDSRPRSAGFVDTGSGAARV